MKSKNKIKLESTRGITLIALVVTIIVLLILAGIAMNLSIGENGIFKKATDSKIRSERASLIEEMQMEIMDKEIKNAGDLYEKELKEILEKRGTLSDEENLLDKTLTTSDGKHSIKVSEIYGGELKESVAIPEGLEIGSTVSYSPSGTYTLDPQYCSSSQNEAFGKTLNSANGEPFNINTWKVFDINETTGEVILVASHVPKSGNIDLEGAQGYNNAVYLLNEACSKLYGDDSKGIKARSIKIEDIEEKMIDSELEKARTGYKYGKQAETGYERSKSYYPSIYAKEELRSLAGEERIESGLGMSEQKSLIKPTDDSAVNGQLQGISLRPTQTYWSTNFSKIAFKTAPNGINYYDLLMPEDGKPYYWVASRWVSIGAYGARFGVFSIFSGSIGTNNRDMTDSTESEGEGIGSGTGLFPMVSLGARLMKGNASDGFAVN